MRVSKHKPTGPGEPTLWMLAVRDRRDRAAFARLFDFYAPRLKAMILRSGLRAEMAEDIVQDVMLAVWHKAAQFDPARAPVSGWIYRIARNRQVDLSRRLPRPEPEPVAGPDAPDPLAMLADTRPDTAQLIALEQEVGRLRAALDQLAPDQRAVIEKAYLGELTHTEIRDRTGLPLGTIKSRIRLGLERLRHELRGLR